MYAVVSSSRSPAPTPDQSLLHTISGSLLASLRASRTIAKAFPSPPRLR
jgi:hypothetical protein